MPDADPSIELSNGVKMPALGLGAWAAGHRNRELVDPLSVSACRDAADSYRQVEQAIKQRGLRVRVRYMVELMHKHTTVVE